MLTELLYHAGAVSLPFCGFRVAEDNEGIALVAGHAPAGFKGQSSACGDRDPLRIPFRMDLIFAQAAA